jgi:hypothetical protein
LSRVSTSAERYSDRYSDRYSERCSDRYSDHDQDGTRELVEVSFFEMQS